jgi:hypothetical protein
MYSQFQAMQAQMYARVRQDQANALAAQAAEQRRLADIATAEANRLAQEAANAAQALETQRLELEESRRINDLLINAIREINGTLSGTSNIQAIFNEATSVIDRFLAIEPLKAAIVARSVNLHAVKLLVEKGQRYDGWSDLVDDGTPLYYFLSDKFKTATPNLRFG